MVSFPDADEISLGLEPTAKRARAGLVRELLDFKDLLEDGDLEMYDVATGKRILSGEERAEEAEQRIDKLEEELRRLRRHINPNGKNGGPASKS